MYCPPPQRRLYGTIATSISDHGYALYCLCPDRQRIALSPSPFNTGSPSTPCSSSASSTGPASAGLSSIRRIGNARRFGRVPRGLSAGIARGRPRLAPRRPRIAPRRSPCAVGVTLRQNVSQNGLPMTSPRVRCAHSSAAPLHSRRLPSVAEDADEFKLPGCGGPIDFEQQYLYGSATPLRPCSTSALGRAAHFIPDCTAPGRR